MPLALSPCISARCMSQHPTTPVEWAAPVLLWCDPTPAPCHRCQGFSNLHEQWEHLPCTPSCQQTPKKCCQHSFTKFSTPSFDTHAVWQQGGLHTTLLGSHSVLWGSLHGTFWETGPIFGIKLLFQVPPPLSGPHSPSKAGPHELSAPRCPSRVSEAAHPAQPSPTPRR